MNAIMWSTGGRAPPERTDPRPSPEPRRRRGARRSSTVSRDRASVVRPSPHPASRAPWRTRRHGVAASQTAVSATERIAAPLHGARPRARATRPTTRSRSSGGGTASSCCCQRWTASAQASGDGRGPVVTVTLPCAEADAALSRIRRPLATALVVLGAWLLTDLERFVHGSAALRDGRANALPEMRGGGGVAPLAAELSRLIAARDGQTARSRAQRADLGHALNIPLAVPADRAGTEDAALSTRMDTMIRWQLNRMRASDAGLDPAARAATSSTQSAGSPDVRGAAEDPTEILGALAENAVARARRIVRLASFAQDGHLVVEIGDDGPGVPAAYRARVPERGARPDDAAPSHGLAIAADRVQASGAPWRSRTSLQAALLASVTLPAARRAAIGPCTGHGPAVAAHPATSASSSMAALIAPTRSSTCRASSPEAQRPSRCSACAAGPAPAAARLGRLVGSLVARSVPAIDTPAGSPARSGVRIAATVLPSACAGFARASTVGSPGRTMATPAAGAAATAAAAGARTVRATPASRAGPAFHLPARAPGPERSGFAPGHEADADPSSRHPPGSPLSPLVVLRLGRRSSERMKMPETVPLSSRLRISMPKAIRTPQRG